MNRNLRPALEALEGKQLMTGLVYSLAESPVVVNGHQKIELTLTITNTNSIQSNLSLPVRMGASIDGFVATQNGVQVWRSNGGINSFLVTNTKLAPQASTSISTMWDEVSPGSKVTAPRKITGPVTFENQLAPSVTLTANVGDTTPPVVVIIPPVVYSPLKKR